MSKWNEQTDKMFKRKRGIKVYSEEPREAVKFAVKRADGWILKDGKVEIFEVKESFHQLASFPEDHLSKSDRKYISENVEQYFRPREV